MGWILIVSDVEAYIRGDFVGDAGRQVDRSRGAVMTTNCPKR
jgi:hypothetical protein